MRTCGPRLHRPTKSDAEGMKQLLAEIAERRTRVLLELSWISVSLEKAATCNELDRLRTMAQDRWSLVEKLSDDIERLEAKIKGATR